MGFWGGFWLSKSANSGMACWFSNSWGLVISGGLVGEGEPEGGEGVAWVDGLPLEVPGTTRFTAIAANTRAAPRAVSPIHSVLLVVGGASGSGSKDMTEPFSHPT